MDLARGYLKSLILAVILAVLGFFWIWLYRHIGGATYWAALIAFAVYVASGSKPRKLPWMVIGGILGVVFGLLTYAMSMLVFPTYAIISSAVAGAIFLLVSGLISVPRMPDILPMTIVGWGCFLSGMAIYEYLLAERVVWAIPKLWITFFGTMLSVVIGLLFGALAATPLLGAAADKTAAGEPE